MFVCRNLAMVADQTKRAVNEKNFDEHKDRALQLLGKNLNEVNSWMIQLDNINIENAQQTQIANLERLLEESAQYYQYRRLKLTVTVKITLLDIPKELPIKVIAKSVNEVVMAIGKPRHILNLVALENILEEHHLQPTQESENILNTLMKMFGFDERDLMSFQDALIFQALEDKNQIEPSRFEDLIVCIEKKLWHPAIIYLAAKFAESPLFVWVAESENELQLIVVDPNESKKLSNLQIILHNSADFGFCCKRLVVNNLTLEEEDDSDGWNDTDDEDNSMQTDNVEKKKEKEKVERRDDDDEPEEKEDDEPPTHSQNDTNVLPRSFEPKATESFVDKSSVILIPTSVEVFVNYSYLLDNLLTHRDFYPNKRLRLFVPKVIKDEVKSLPAAFGVHTKNRQAIQILSYYGVIVQTNNDHSLASAPEADLSRSEVPTRLNNQWIIFKTYAQVAMKVDKSRIFFLATDNQFKRLLDEVLASCARVKPWLQKPEMQNPNILLLHTINQVDDVINKVY